jgi:hypothetical protein
VGERERGRHKEGIESVCARRGKHRGGIESVCAGMWEGERGRKRG